MRKTAQQVESMRYTCATVPQRCESMRYALTRLSFVVYIRPVGAGFIPARQKQSWYYINRIAHRVVNPRTGVIPLRFFARECRFILH